MGLLEKLGLRDDPSDKLCGSIEVRRAGAREVTRLCPLLAAYATAWFERN